ncbi:MAG: putative manganese transporter [Longicatena sp.]
MTEIMRDVIHDSLPMLPFLFLTYFLMEYLEHKTSNSFQKHLEGAKKLGPLVGALLGIVPQCGFSVLASGLYMNNSISLGTLLAVFISTSDEAIPILVAQPNQMNTLINVIVVKLIVAFIVGYACDFLVNRKLLQKNHPLHNIHQECDLNIEEEHHSIVYIASVHTLKIFGFIFFVNLGLSLFIHYIGKDTLSTLLANGSFLQPLLASIVGLIPNCAASVMLAQLYIDGVLSFGALCAGLITSAGLGLLVLLKMYDNKRDILRILTILFLSALLPGILLQWM